MIRQVFAILAGVLLLAPAAWAEQSPGEPGRYQVIPGAMVPGKGGTSSEHTILLDSATGRTWLLSPGPGFGGLPGQIWTPLMVKPNESAGKSAKSSTAPKQQAVGKTPPVKPKPLDRFEYDENP